MKSVKIFAAVAVMFSSAAVFASDFSEQNLEMMRGRGSYTVSRTFSGSGVVDCRERGNGRAVACIDIGHGRNHSCRRASATACVAREGNGNGGTAGCMAECR